MYSTDTLSYDSIKIARYQADANYDYNSQLVHQETSLSEWLKHWMSAFLERLFGNEFAQKYTGTFLIVAFIILILLLIFFIYRKRPELFYREKKKWTYNEKEETIYGIHFSNEIGYAVERKDYKLAIRLVYLQTLKYLSDNKLIDWQTYKTPTEYLYEMKRKEVKEEFRQLTHRFLMVRYGNFDATIETFEAVKSLQQIIWKGGTDEGKF